MYDVISASVFSFKSVSPLRVVKLFNLLYTVRPGASKALRCCSDSVRACGRAVKCEHRVTLVLWGIDQFLESLWC